MEMVKVLTKPLRVHLLLKNSFDIIFSLFVIVFVLVWLVPILFVFIKLTTGEKVFYVQQRVGLQGVPFNMIKFRSMRGIPPKNDPLLSEEEKHRITKLGGLLRKYRIDELPQFINVLKGEMSVVGPRPERQYFLDKIYKEIPQYKKLLQIKPGITSLGQIRFGYADSLKEMLQRARYDLIYLDNFNFITDVKVILATLVVVIKGKGK